MTFQTLADKKGKRGLTRFPMRSKVKITSSTGETLFGECLNISGGGMLVYAEKEIPADTEINVEILEERIDFNATARVVRSTLSDGGALLGLAVI